MPSTVWSFLSVNSFNPHWTLVSIAAIHILQAQIVDYVGSGMPKIYIQMF